MDKKGSGEDLTIKPSIEQSKELPLKGKIINWLSYPSNLALVAILLFAIIIRLYYFWMTSNQPLWWDELCYGSLAKNFISHAWDGTNIILYEMHIRPLMFSFMWAFLMILHLGEVASRFLLVLVPSILSVFFTYLLGKEIFNKKIGLISAAIFAVIWLNLFYSSRFLVHMLEMCFLISSMYFFVRSTKNEMNLKYFMISLILLSLATLTRYQDGLMFFIYFIVLILGKKLYLNRVKFWYAGLLGLVPLLLFFIMNLITQGNILPALFGGDYVSAASEKVPFAFNLLGYIPTFLQTPFLIAFIIGLVYLLFEIILGYNFISSDSKLRNSTLLILLLVVFFAFFIFYLRSAEDRWLFETLISLTILSAFGLDLCGKFLEKYNKWLGIILIVLVLILGSYAQLNVADPLIKDKKESYLQIKSAFEWIKINTPENSVIAGMGIEPYAIYYADRQYLQLTDNVSDTSKIKTGNYLMVHGFTNQPTYLNDYIMQNNATLKPVHVETYNNQPIVVLYQVTSKD